MDRPAAAPRDAPHRPRTHSTALRATPPAHHVHTRTPGRQGDPAGASASTQRKPVPIRRSAATPGGTHHPSGLPRPSASRPAGSEEQPMITESDRAQPLAPAAPHRTGPQPGRRNRRRDRRAPHADQQCGPDSTPPSKPWTAREGALWSATRARPGPPQASPARCSTTRSGHPAAPDTASAPPASSHKDDRPAEASTNTPHAPAPVRRPPAAHRTYAARAPPKPRGRSGPPHNPEAGAVLSIAPFATLSVPKFYLRTS